MFIFSKLTKSNFNFFYERLLIRLWRDPVTLACCHAGLFGQQSIGTNFSTCKLFVNFIKKQSLFKGNCVNRMHCMGNCVMVSALHHAFSQDMKHKYSKCAIMSVINMLF